MFERWDSFYLLVGGAAGALIGLLFIVATLARGRDRDSALYGASIYMTPVVQHLALVLVVSALATAPGLPTTAAAAIIGLCGLTGVVIAGRVAYHLRFAETFKDAHWSDIWLYGAAPLAADLLLAASAAAALLASAQTAAGLVAASLVLILLLAIRNAWDMVTWISAITNTGGQLGVTPPTASKPDA